ncbi:MAG: hypothetical protein GX051_07980 [Clostridiales bacterium]|nr:hypothetical protein [Clostridiales bacterium]
MQILGINRVLNWLQITSGGRSYTCITKEINGELCFLFKKKWHKVAEYLSEYTTELVSEGGKLISRKLK